ncbi:hypothetical protein CHARACLAT_023615 [Characodon lateralis]|uniref:Uncharacterized protein n=1 Tax=Characodon lateralis TaxID=208331 RepID=A0ABU7DVD3_9TELE|nr:hypothetical protein [Characodon lateralis]
MFFHSYSMSPSNRVMNLFKDASRSCSSSYLEEYSNNKVLHPTPINQLTAVKSVELPLLKHITCSAPREKLFNASLARRRGTNCASLHKNFPHHAPWLERKYGISWVCIGCLMQLVAC